jgi:hypothetical protein
MKNISPCKEIIQLRRTNEKVKDCPFCGSSEIMVENTHTAAYWVECCECLVEIPGEYEDDTLEGHKKAFLSAIDCWNSRM